MHFALNVAYIAKLREHCFLLTALTTRETKLHEPRQKILESQSLISQQVARKYLK
jgi:hypothetical protein